MVAFLRRYVSVMSDTLYESVFSYYSFMYSYAGGINITLLV